MQHHETHKEPSQKKKSKTRNYQPHHNQIPNHYQIRITVAGQPPKYIAYALSLLQDKRTKVVTLMAMGRAISTAVMTAEAVRQCISGIHQDVSVGVQEVEDVRDPYTGLERVKPFKRQIASIEIHLSTHSAEINSASIGYQAPHTKEQIVGLQQVENMLGVKVVLKHGSKRLGHGRGRGGGFKGQSGHGHPRSRRMSGKGRGQGSSKGAKRQTQSRTTSESQHNSQGKFKHSSKAADKTKKSSST